MSRLLFAACYDLMTARGTKREFITQVADAEAGGIRIFGQYAWGDNVCSTVNQVADDERINDYHYAPEIRACLKKRGRCWWFNRPEDPAVWMPLYDLEDASVWHEDELSFIAEEARAAGLALEVDLDDFCSLKSGGIEKYRHPYICSIQALSTSTPGGVWGDALWPYIRAIWKREIRALRRTKVKLYAWSMNEGDALDHPDEFMLRWFERAADTLRKYRVKKKRMIASAMRNWEAIADMAGYYSMHGIVRPEKVLDYGYPHRKIIISGDGGFDGEGKPDEKGRRGVSVEHAKLIAEKIIEMGYGGAEVLDRGLYRKNNDRAMLEDYDNKPIKTMAQMFF